MLNKYKPKMVCECGNITWNFNNETKQVKCKKCGKLMPKELHGVIGAELYKNKENNYVLEFKEFNEKAIFSKWEDIEKELDELRKNEVENDRQGVQ